MFGEKGYQKETFDMYESYIKHTIIQKLLIIIQKPF